LEKAKQGFPVVTRDGHKLEIIDFNGKTPNYPIEAQNDKGEHYFFTINGKFSFYNSSRENPNDLFMQELEIKTKSMKTTIPFDVTKARQGATVVTRDGYKVKIYDYDCGDNNYPIVGFIFVDKATILPQKWKEDGTASPSQIDKSTENNDLFIEEEVEDDDYNPYKEVVKSIADMDERCSELQSIEEFIRIQCRNLLEKCKEQEEQETKVKPKFHKNDWIVQDNVGTFKITEICESWYEVIDSDESNYSISFDQESMCHLWSIQEAKPGDVLAIDWKGNEHGYDWQKIVIFKSLTEFSVEGYGNTFKNNELAFEDESVPHLSNKWTKNLHPATKEQRDLLFQKMKEAGYEWNSDKKELHKIEEVKKRRMTHQELSWWLRDCPEEHRELKMSVDDPIIDSLYYYDNETNVTVNKDIIIRRNGGEWEEPIVDNVFV